MVGGQIGRKGRTIGEKMLFLICAIKMHVSYTRPSNTPPPPPHTHTDSSGAVMCDSEHFLDPYEITYIETISYVTNLFTRIQ